MKVIEFFKDFDIFSESVQFNASRRRLRKRTVAGAFLTISIIVLTIIYFAYQSYLYFTGQMDPKFRQQTFVSNDIQLQINNEMFGFDFFSLQTGKYLSERQEQQNQTYIVYLATFISTNSSGNSRIPLDIIKCQSKELKGLNCFDFSKIPSPELLLKDHQTVFKYINMYIYRCQDIDKYKTFVPNNCAEEKLIDKFLAVEPYRLMVKMQVSQFNITSQQIESQYKMTNLATQINTVNSNEFKLMKQVSKIQQGFIVQSEQTFSSPISSAVASQSISRKQLIDGAGLMFIGQIFFTLDESVTYFNIQFPIFTEVLALCNSTLALLLLFGSFCRKLAQKFIRRDIFFILMKDFFSGTYFNVLEHNNVTNLNNQNEQKQLNQDDQMGNDEESKKNICMPHLEIKSSFRVLQQQSTNQGENTEQDYVKEEMKTQIRQSEQLIESLKISDCKFSKIQTSLDKQQELQMISSLNKSNQNENDIEQVPSIFRGKSPRQQLQFFAKDSISSTRSLKGSPAFQMRLNRIKKPDQQIQMETENDKKKIFNSSQKIDQNFQNLNDKSIQYKLEQILFKPVLFKQKDYLHSKGMKQQVVSEIESRIDDSLDFFVFYKDILLIKKAIMIMLNKEQLAALQFVGMDLEKLNQENTIMTNQLGIFILLTNSNIKNLKQLDETYTNHFKEQYEILLSKELQLQYINEFFKKCQQNKNIDIIDKRILSSIYINSQN